jgi:hypothetical protein
MIPHKLNWNSGDQIKKLGSKAPSVNRTWTWSYPKEHESCCKDIIWWMKEIPGTSCSTNSTHTVKSTSKNVEVPSVGICKRWTPPSTSNLKIDLANNTKLKLS